MNEEENEDEDDYYYDVWDEDDYTEDYDVEENRPVTRIDFKKWPLLIMQYNVEHTVLWILVNFSHNCFCKVRKHFKWRRGRTTHSARRHLLRAHWNIEREMFCNVASRNVEVIGVCVNEWSQWWSMTIIMVMIIIMVMVMIMVNMISNLRFNEAQIKTASQQEILDAINLLSKSPWWAFSDC